MTEVQETTRVSFRQWERGLLGDVLALGLEAMKQALGEMDEALAAGREKERYVIKGLREREMETLLGHLRFRRRYYLDRTTGRYVCLLDEALGIAERSRVSPGLDELAVHHGVSGPSYRKGVRDLEAIYGRPVISHETMRQRVLGTGAAIARVAIGRQECAAGEGRVPVVYIEVDGLHTHMQRPKGVQENRVAVVHEGWERRSPGSREYRLKNATYCVVRDGPEAWEEISRHVYSLYRLDDTVVVINGDRASWIRKGTECFSDAKAAIYQVDRFHVTRDLKQVLSLQPEMMSKALKAYRQSRAADLLEVLRKAAGREVDLEQAERIRALHADLMGVSEGLVDYRHRLWARGIPTEGMRGLGAAESHMDRLANRVKKRGQSWRKAGIQGILHAVCKDLEGDLHAYASLAAAGRAPVDREALREAVDQAVRKRIRALAQPTQGHFPMADQGHVATGGLSDLFRRISQPADLAG